MGGPRGGKGRRGNEETRVDPADGSARTWDETVALYKRQKYKMQDIKHYWDNDMAGAPPAADAWGSAPAAAAQGKTLDAIPKPFEFIDINGDPNRLDMADGRLSWQVPDGDGGWRPFVDGELTLDTESGELKDCQSGNFNATLKPADVQLLLALLSGPAAAEPGGKADAPEKEEKTAPPPEPAKVKAAPPPEPAKVEEQVKPKVVEALKPPAQAGAPAQAEEARRGPRGPKRRMRSEDTGHFLAKAARTAPSKVATPPRARAHRDRAPACSPSLLWECVRRSSSFRRNPGREVRWPFSAEPGNLLSRHCLGSSAITGDRPLDVRPVRDGIKERIELIQGSAKPSNRRCPGKVLVRRGVSKCPGRGIAQLQAELEAGQYPQYLIELAFEKYAKIHLSFRKKERVVKSRRAKVTK